MTKPRDLEDFRLNNYLVPYLASIKHGPEEANEMSYTIYAIHAFYSTMEDVKDLEGQTTFVNNGKRSTVSISLWFLALESFVNCISKIVCLKENKNFIKELSTKSIAKRLSFILDTFPTESGMIKKSGLITRVNEFLQFRNEIFHDRNVGEQIKFHKTNFSQIPFLSNQVDVFQALLIFLETCCALRYVVINLDLMPNISIGNNNVLIFEKFDKVYNEFLKPFFIEVLKKHNLSTKLNLDMDHFFQAEPNSNGFFKRGEIIPIFRNAQQAEFMHPLNTEKTSIGSKLYNDIVISANRPNGHHDSMNFMINWPKLSEDSSQVK